MMTGSHVRPPTARRALATPVAVGVLGLALIGTWQSIPLRHSIEEDLTTRSVAALRTAGLAGVGVDFTGRDATINAAASPAIAAQARDVVLGVEGVRVVDLATSLAAPDDGAAPGEGSATTAPDAPASATPTPGSSASGQFPTSLTFDAGTVTLTGSVGSPTDRAALVAAATAGKGGWSVVDQLVIDPSLGSGGSADWYAGITGLVSAVPVDTSNLIARYVDGGVVLRGTATSAAAEQALLAAAAPSALTGTVKDALTVQAGAPADSPADQAAADKKLRDLPKISFESGSARLTPAGARAVAKAAVILKDFPDLRVRVEGYTDSAGSAALNLSISKQRATVVKNRLVTLGVRTELSSKGFGEAKPLVKERSTADADRNRRVEFTILK